MRLSVEALYWWRRICGTRGHLAACRHVEVELVGRAGGRARLWTCAAGCPKLLRDASAERRAIERWAGHRGR